MYFDQEIFAQDPLELYDRAFGESIQGWFDTSGDIDDFIFFDVPERITSER